MNNQLSLNGNNVVSGMKLVESLGAECKYIIAVEIVGQSETNVSITIYEALTNFDSVKTNGDVLLRIGNLHFQSSTVSVALRGMTIIFNITKVIMS